MGTDSGALTGVISGQWLGTGEILLLVAEDLQNRERLLTQLSTPANDVIR